MREPATSTSLWPSVCWIVRLSSTRRCGPRADRVAGKIARGRREIVAAHVAGHPDMSGPFAHREQIRSAAGFPLLYSLQTVGVLFVSYRSDHRFSPKELEHI